MYTALATQIAPYNHVGSCLDDFGFRGGFPTYSHVEKRIHDDNKGWTRTVHFKNGDSVTVECRGMAVTIDGKPYTHGNINNAVTHACQHPNSYYQKRPIHVDANGKSWTYSDEELTALGYEFPPCFDDYYAQFNV